MTHSKHNKIILSPGVFLFISFVIPTAILLGLSDPTKLGPIYAMLLALAFPLALELYSIRIRRKPSIMAIAAIVGVLLIGMISILGLSEEWLALRRSIFFIAVGVGLLAAARFKPLLLEKGLANIIDLEMVQKVAKKQKVERELHRHIRRTVYATAVLFLLMAVLAYVLTIVVISAPTNSPTFNAQYAELRLISIPVVTVPMIIGVTALLVYLAKGIEKMTGVEMEDLLKKR